MKKSFLFIFMSLTPFAFSAQDRGPLLHTDSQAQEKKWALLKKELRGRRNPLTSKVIRRRLEGIYYTMGRENKEDKTLKLITNLEKIVQKRPSELARLYKLKAQIYLGKDQYKKAFSYYRQALDLKALPFREHIAVLYDQATLYMLQNKLHKSALLVDQIFYLTDNISPGLYILKAAILLEKKQKEQALKMVMIALDSTSNPKEGWLAFAAALNLALERYSKAAEFLEQLTNTYPDKKKYWKQLSAVYLNIKKDDKALATLDLAYKLNFLEVEQEIIHLATLLMVQGISLKAAKLLEKSLELKKIKPSQKNYESLGDCWLRAEEITPALEAYKKSAPLAKNGKVLAKMGQIYIQNGKWLEAINSFKKALEKGELKYPENIYISLGISYLGLKKYEQATTFFKKVSDTKAKGQLIKVARQWIDYSKSLLKQQEQN